MATSQHLQQNFSLSDGKLFVRGIPVLTHVTKKTSLTSFESPLPIHAGLLGFSQNDSSSDKAMNSLGKFRERNFLSIFSFKPGKFIQCVGTSSSELQKETQWVLIEVPEVNSYMIIIPVNEGGYRSTISTDCDENLMVNQGYYDAGDKVNFPNFHACAYVQVSSNPYSLIRQACVAVSSRFNCFKLIPSGSNPSNVIYLVSGRVPNNDHPIMGDFNVEGANIVHSSYNNLWLRGLGSSPVQAEKIISGSFHAASKAISNSGPVYLSVRPGDHNNNIISKLVFPDGSLAKFTHYALPTRDIIFKNPLSDDESVLKIWNLNKFGGIIGVFNCQEATAWDPQLEIYRNVDCYKPVLCGTVHVTEIEWSQKLEASHIAEVNDFAVYFNQAKELRLVSMTSEPIPFTVKPSTFELYSFVPVTNLGGGSIRFAPIGLTNMFNSGGTVLDIGFENGPDEVVVMLKVKGGGTFLAYSSACPRESKLNDTKVAFKWFSDGGKFLLSLPWIQENRGHSDVTIIFNCIA